MVKSGDSLYLSDPSTGPISIWQGLHVVAVAPNVPEGTINNDRKRRRYRRHLKGS
jgi:hypothetical protein